MHGRENGTPWRTRPATPNGEPRRTGHAEPGATLGWIGTMGDRRPTPKTAEIVGRAVSVVGGWTAGGWSGSVRAGRFKSSHRDALDMNLEL